MGHASLIWPNCLWKAGELRVHFSFCQSGGCPFWIWIPLCVFPDKTSLCLSQCKIRASQALWLLWAELLLLLDVRFTGGQPASSLLEVRSIVADSALRQVDNIWWPELSFRGGEQCSDTEPFYLSALSPWLSPRRHRTVVPSRESGSRLPAGGLCSETCAFWTSPLPLPPVSSVAQIPFLLPGSFP